MSLIKPLDMKYVSKPWGHELWITNDNKHCGKTLFIKQGRHCNFHWHKEKDKVLHVQSGLIWINYQIPNERIHYEKIKAGHAFHVSPGMKHQMQAIEDTVILEFSTQHFEDDYFDETDKLVIDHSAEFSFGK